MDLLENRISFNHAIRGIILHVTIPFKNSQLIRIRASTRQILQSDLCYQHDSYQPVHPFSMARVLVHPILDSCRKHILSAMVLIRLHGAQVDLSLRLSHTSYCRFNPFSFSCCVIVAKGSLLSD